MVFAGLPGSGKSVLARGVSDAIGATYLRIDTIESAIVSTLMPYGTTQRGTSLPSGSPPTNSRAGTWWPTP